MRKSRTKVYFIITTEEGSVKRFSVDRSKLKFMVFSSSAFVCLLLVMSVLSAKFFADRLLLQQRVARLDLRLSSVIAENESLKNRVAQLQQEKQRILEDAVAELKKRSMAIEQILSGIGVKNKVKSDTGGPYIPADDSVDYRSLLEKADKLIKLSSNIPLGWPVHGRITSGFGMRIDPFNGKWAFHPGIDIKNKFGTPVRATADGIVRVTGYDRGGYGRFVIIDHGNGFRTVYAHLYRIKVRRWQRVKRGEIIGLVGSTGRSTGPHLHYEVRYRGKVLNPVKFVRVDRYVRGF